MTIFLGAMTLICLLITVIFFALALTTKDALNIIWAYYSGLSAIATSGFFVLTAISLIIGYCFQ